MQSSEGEVLVTTCFVEEREASIQLGQTDIGIG